ncbi:hypothetical protein ASG54_13390 [Aureimonas sp. Leaf460]|nr:hypothetical protein ASG62_09520 [Aureimonas sp. Leaf427]KQT77219.1 hypothetical protein ASG54_13390 [Aureimonas sp. Leaf460]
MKPFLAFVLLISSALPAVAEDCNIYAQVDQPVDSSTISLVRDDNGVITEFLLKEGAGETRYKVFRPNPIRPELAAVPAQSPDDEPLLFVKTPISVQLASRTFDLRCGG